MSFNLSKREKRVFLITCAVLLLSAVYNFLLEPMVKIWTKLDKQILTQKTRLKKDLQTISQRETIESRYARYLSLISMEGPDEKRQAELLGEIERTASRAAVQINQMKPRQVKDVGLYRKFSVELEAKASIESLSRFIYDLENQPPSLRIEKLQLNARGTQSNILNCYILITQISVDGKR